MRKIQKSTCLYGRISVKERLKANPKSIRQLLLQDNIKLDDIEQLARRNNIPIERSPEHKMQSFKPAKDLQGVIAKTEAFEYADFEDLPDKGLSIILLDRVNDPQNLGAILRTSACFGRIALVIPEFEACPVTDAALHVASGAENYVPVAMVNNLVNCITQLKKADYWIVGAEAGPGSQSIFETNLPFPLAVVLGSEGEGIRPGIKKHLDLLVSIPMNGVPLSFNVAIAQAIISYEIARQRK